MHLTYTLGGINVVGQSARGPTYGRSGKVNETLWGGGCKDATDESFDEMMDVAIGLSGSALVVEDNFIIASGLQMDLLDLGFDAVDIADSNDSAFSILQNLSPDVALLDLYLGRETTSLGIAARLRQMGVPFAFVSGAAEHDGLTNEFAQVPVLMKPVSLDELQATLSALLADKG